MHTSSLYFFFWVCVYVVCICVHVGARGKSVLVLMCRPVWVISLVTSPWLYRHWGNRPGLPHLTVRVSRDFNQGPHVCSSSSTHWTSLRVTPCSFNRTRRHCPQCLCLGTVLTPGRSICSLELWVPCLPSTRSYTTVGQRLVISYPRTLAS